MYCSSCGVEVPESARFCMQCGAPMRNTRSATVASTGVRMSRPRDNRKIAGVCSGIARYFGMDVTLVRILFVVFLLWPPCAALVVYIVCWIVMPEDPLLVPPAAPVQNVPA
jgi:phage shock protein C